MLAQSKGILVGRKFTPFTLDQTEIPQMLQDWLSRGFLVPKDAANMAEISSISRVLVPYFIYNCQIAVEWRGYGGDYVRETVAGAGGTAEVKKVVNWVEQSGLVQDQLQETRLASKDIDRHLRRFFLKYGWEGKPVGDWSEVAARELNATVIPADLDAQKIFTREFQGKLFRKIESEINRSVHGEEKRGITWRKFLEYRYLELYAPYYSVSYTYQGKEYQLTIDASETSRQTGKKPRRSIFSLFRKSKPESNE
ncbi:MAG: hypothetical protein EYC62_07900 [Alphaproteobacteria bacterium]|nr:MAG: hypothetical protein EYC62_07900 [Alphaproteobacteria bacterium]